jgi:hypothetical protein
VWLSRGGVTKGRAASEATALYSVDRARRSTRPPTLNVSATSRIIIHESRADIDFGLRGFYGSLCHRFHVSFLSCVVAGRVRCAPAVSFVLAEHKQRKSPRQNPREPDRGQALRRRRQALEPTRGTGTRRRATPSDAAGGGGPRRRGEQRVTWKSKNHVKIEGETRTTCHFSAGKEGFAGIHRRTLGKGAAGARRSTAWPTSVHPVAWRLLSQEPIL